MAGMISQNAVPNEPIKKKKRKTQKHTEQLFDEGKEIVENGDEIDLDTGKIQKKKRAREENDAMTEIQQQKEMKKLESILFGSLYSPLEFGKGDEEEEESSDKVDNSSAVFFTDRSANRILSVYEEDVESGEERSEIEDSQQRKPAWLDDEEEKAAVNIAKVNKLRKLRKEEDESVISGAAYVSRLRAQHRKMNPGTHWAKLDAKPTDYSSDDEDSDKQSEVVAASGHEDPDDILRTDEDLIERRGVKLLPGLLEYSRLVDANKGSRSNGLVSSVQFHENGQLLLVGGLDKTLNFFNVDGRKNEKADSAFFEHYPIRRASFLPGGSEVIISGRRKFFYSYDLVKARVQKIGPLAGRDEESLETFEVSPDSSTIAFIGNEGYILLVSSKTKELIGTLKMNGTARAVAFANDGQQLLSFGGDGQIYHWDMRTRTCFHRGTDEGCVHGTAICTSLARNLFAAGSESGIVNVYNREEFLGGKRKPLKAIENLTTRVSSMKFNPDAQILAISSNMKKSSLKLIHVPSFTVFSNWPPPNQSLHHATSMDFSPHGGFMALGNAAGEVLLYKLHHYSQA